jgi:16S rRNA (guanine966-N2)-methyltransferase
MKRSKSPAKPTQSGQFRIIGGQWRSRKLQFPAVEGLRPTPDRVRETLFNWLADDIQGATCLDLYSGCGALGLEALSRGAAFCTFADKSAPALNAINAHLKLLNGQGETLLGDLPTSLLGFKRTVNIVFIDPPYALDSHLACLNTLIAQQCLAPSTWLYCENASDKPLPPLPHGFELYRHKVAGAVQYALFRYQATA